MKITQEDVNLIKEQKVDSRIKNTKETHPIYALERAYCLVCSKPGGYVSQESSKYIKANNVIYVCDFCSAEINLGLQQAPVKEIKI